MSWKFQISVKLSRSRILTLQNVDCFIRVKNVLSCRVKVDKKIADCGHTLKNIECGRNVKRSGCLSSCEKKLACGHRCKQPCCDPCNPKACRELVDLSSMKLECGHRLRSECHLRYAGKIVLHCTITVLICWSWFEMVWLWLRNTVAYSEFCYTARGFDLGTLTITFVTNLYNFIFYIFFKTIQFVNMSLVICCTGCQN